MRRIKNSNKLTKEDLTICLLKSETSDVERNYMKHFNNNNNNNNSNNNNNEKIRGKISDIRMILSRLGNIVDINDRKKIKKELYETEEKKNLSKREKEKIYDHLIKLVNTSIKKKNISIMTVMI